MSRFHHNSKHLFIALTVMIFSVSMHTPVFARMVTTPQIIEAQKVEQNRSNLNELLSRKDVQNALKQQGVDPESVRLRVNSMTDAEIQTMSANLDQFPAGAGLSTTHILLIIIIIILII